jgi:NAD(P)-dependent dehydrogenase (short-subunit alcohol dehydrogenase family)
VAERLASDGFAVVINYPGDAAPAEALAGKIAAPGPTATNLLVDGKLPQLVGRMAQTSLLERLGTPQDIAAPARSPRRIESGPPTLPAR